MKAALKPPTAIQVVVLKFMYAFYLANDQLPPMAVISAHMGYSQGGGCLDHLKGLEARGLLERNAVKKLKFSAAGRKLVGA